MILAQPRTWLLPLVLLASLALGIQAAAGGPLVVDGTFRLRGRQRSLDAEIRARLAADARFAALYREIGRPRPTLAVGTQMNFLVFNFASNQYESRSATLKVSGTSCHLFVADDSAGLLGPDPAGTLGQIRRNFDEKVFPTITDWFGTVAIPPGFGLPDGRIYILLADIRDGMDTGYVAGYFDSRDLDGENNRKPVFFMDLNPGRPGDPADKNNDFYKTLAHEFQHMINYSRHLALGAPQEDRWVEEGLSGFAEYLYTAQVGNDGAGLPPSPHLSRFLENPDINLTHNSDNEWFQAGTLFRHYGASFLYLYYLQEKYGGTTEAERKAFVRQVVNNRSVGTTGLNEILATKNGTSFEASLRNWFIANHLNDVSLNHGLWGYLDKGARLGAEAAGLPVRGTQLTFSAAGLSFLGGEGEILPNAARYIDLAGTGKIALSFKGSPSAFTPFVVTVDRASPPAALIEDISINPETGSATIDLDLGALSRAVLVPAVATTVTSLSTRFFYQYSARAANLVLYPIPNPAFTKDFLIVVKSLAGPLTDTPRVAVTFNNLSTTPAPEMKPADASRTLFVGNYHIPPGSGEGVVSATIGADTSSFAFYHSELAASVITRLQVREAQFSISSRVEGDHASLFETALSDIPPGLRVLSKPYYTVFNAQNALEARLQFEGSVLPVDRESQLGLWSGPAAGKGWSKVSRNERGVFGAITAEGSYVLVADTEAPRIHDLHIDDRDGRPTLSARVADDGSGLDRDSVRVEVNGAAVPFSLDPVSGQVAADLSRLPQGNHQFSLEAADLAGNPTQAALQETLAGPLRVLQAAAWPNPARGFSNLAVILGGSGADDPTLEVEARVFDAAGQKVTTLALSYKSNHTFAARWDCRNEDGRAAANGVYPFRIVIRRGGETLKANGTLAILR